MKNFTDRLVDLIVTNERPRMDRIMDEVTKKVSVDFASTMFRLIDKYYENYDPIYYVRVYGKRGKYLKNRKPKGGQVSLHAAVTRAGENGAAISFSGTNDQGNYVGGIEFDESKFKNNEMRHFNKGIEEWNIVENFLFAGTGENADGENLKGDIRSHIDYSYPSADLEMMRFMNTYGSTLDKHYNRALKNVK